MFQFKLEDVNKIVEPPSTPSYIRRQGAANNTTSRPSSAPVETAETTVTLPLRRPKTVEEKGKYSCNPYQLPVLYLKEVDYFLLIYLI